MISTTPPAPHQNGGEVSAAGEVCKADNPQNDSQDQTEDLSDQMAALSTGCSAKEVEAYALSLQQQCRDLLAELEKFQAYLKQKNVEKNVEIRPFKNAVQSEMKTLDKLANADHSSSKSTHALRSTNLSFYSAVWSTAKNSTNIAALRKRFYWLPGHNKPYFNGKVSSQGIAHKQHSTVVDIVAKDGLEWIKVSYITEKRILWDLAKAGWAGDDSNEEEEFSDNDDDPQGLLKQAEALKKAALATRVRYCHPSVRLVLPRVKSTPDIKEVAIVLQKIRDLGITIDTMDSIPITSPSLNSVLTQLVTGPFSSFTKTLNVDCTILLAFASDLSHGRVEPEDWHNKAISRQIEMENENQLLPASLWPACGGRKLVCTREAAVRMQEIVAIIGTPSERRRTSLLLNLEPQDLVLTHEERIAAFGSLSTYDIPQDWQIPLQIIDVDVPSILSSLPSAAEKVAKDLSPINQSVFLYGWSTGWTTISSNRAVAKEIEGLIEAERNGIEELRGPDVWLMKGSRSLVGKEKQRAKGNEKDGHGDEV